MPVEFMLIVGGTALGMVALAVICEVALRKLQRRRGKIAGRQRRQF